MKKLIVAAVAVVMIAGAAQAETIESQQESMAEGFKIYGKSKVMKAITKKMNEDLPQQTDEWTVLQQSPEGTESME